MTIRFMVLGGPRSGTTWLANLLTTDTTLCMHDPLLAHRAGQLDALDIPGKRLGIADTSALASPEWVWAHSARKVVLWRDPVEFNASLRMLGLREIDPQLYVRWIKAAPKGVPVIPWREIFSAAGAKRVCKQLDVPFDRWRFEELVQMNVQPEFTRVPVGREAAQDLVRRVAEAVK